MTALPRCPVPACPIRYRTGDSRLCAHHRDDDTTNLATRTRGFGVTMTAFGDEGDSDDTMTGQGT